MAVTGCGGDSWLGGVGWLTRCPECFVRYWGDLEGMDNNLWCLQAVCPGTSPSQQTEMPGTGAPRVCRADKDCWDLCKVLPTQPCCVVSQAGLLCVVVGHIKALWGRDLG